MNRRGAVKAALLLVVAANALVVAVAMTRSDDAAEAVEPISVSVVLLDAGNEPRQVRRFTPEPGSTMHTTIEAQRESTVRVPGEASAMFDMAEFEIDLLSTVTDTDTGAERITVELRAVDFRLGDRHSLDPAILADVDDELQALTDSASETKVVDARGVISRGAVDAAPERQAMLGLIPASYAPAELYPLPIEPVGVGARWRTRSQFSGGEIYGRPLTWNVVVHLELVEVLDDRAVADVEYEASLALGTDRPFVDGSQIVSMDQALAGSVTWYFDHPGALVTGEVTTTGRMLTDVQGEMATVDVEQRTEFRETRTG